MSSESFASTDEYLAAYGEEIEIKRLEVLLSDATQRIKAELEVAGIDPATKGDDYRARLSQVCRSMVHRCVDQHDGGFGEMPTGVTSFSQGIGDFSCSYSFANVYTEPKLTKDERIFLGIKKYRSGFSLIGGD